MGNVRAVISDVKNPLSMSGSIDNWRFRVERHNLSNCFGDAQHNCYPYGMQIPTGIYSKSDDYNFGYNAIEKLPK